MPTSIGPSSASLRPAPPPRARDPALSPTRRGSGAYLVRRVGGGAGDRSGYLPYDKLCGIRLIFFLFAAGLALLMGFLGALASWAHHRALAHVISLVVMAWAAAVVAREVLPRTGYAKQDLTWTCPEEPPAAAPAPTQ